MAPDLTEARDLAAMWKARAQAAEAALDGARADARGWREECDGLMSSLETTAWERDESRAIIAGRDVAPTDAEAEAHRTAGGFWRWAVTADGEPLPGRCDDGAPWPDADPIGEPLRIGVVYSARWWALDSQRRPCAWPVAP